MPTPDSEVMKKELETCRRRISLIPEPNQTKNRPPDSGTITGITENPLLLRLMDG